MYIGRDDQLPRKLAWPLVLCLILNSRFNAGLFFMNIGSLGVLWEPGVVPTEMLLCQFAGLVVVSLGALHAVWLVDIIRHGVFAAGIVRRCKLETSQSTWQIQIDSWNFGWSRRPRADWVPVETLFQTLVAHQRRKLVDNLRRLTVISTLFGIFAGTGIGLLVQLPNINPMLALFSVAGGLLGFVAARLSVPNLKKDAERRWTSPITLSDTLCELEYFPATTSGNVPQRVTRKLELVVHEADGQDVQRPLLYVPKQPWKASLLSDMGLTYTEQNGVVQVAETFMVQRLLWICATVVLACLAFFA